MKSFTNSFKHASPREVYHTVQSPQTHQKSTCSLAGCSTTGCMLVPRRSLLAVVAFVAWSVLAVLRVAVDTGSCTGTVGSLADPRTPAASDGLVVVGPDCTDSSYSLLAAENKT